MTGQIQALNRILQNKDFSLVTMNDLTEDFFFNYPNEFNFIKNHYNTYHCIPDIETFKSVFEDFPLIQVNEPDTFILEQLFRDHSTSYLTKSFNTMKELLESGETEKATEYLKKINEGMRTGTALTCTDLISNFSRYDSFIERSNGGANKYLSTGLLELDRALCGGIDPTEENMVIAARTGIGKTWLLCIFAAAFSKQGKTVGFYSGEMSADKVGYRIDTLLGNIRNSSITRGDADPAMQIAYKRYLDSLADRDLGPIKVITPNDIAGPATVNALQAFVEKEHIDVLLIDQYSLLEDTSRSTVMHERVANISKAIKNLQVMKRIPVISVAQMNRTKEEDKDGNKVQDTTQIGLSDRIGQDATVILMLDKNVDKQTNATQLVINPVKLRDGGDNSKLVYCADFNTGRFDFIDVADSQEAAQRYRDEYAPTGDDSEGF